MPVEVIAEKLERTEKAVMAKATRIGADIVSRLRGRRWTRAEVSLFGKFSAEEMAEMIIRQRVKPMPSREELLKRNSFPSVNQNKYLNAMLRSGKK